jgi:hypothetical protein
MLLVVLFLMLKPVSAALDKRIRNEIVIAYMNGYVEALQLDIIKIKKLKRDSTLLRKTVAEATEKYISTVEKMND